ncbi:MAG TPA: hydantoinase/oxoprolinase family protein, partial [Burkholderiales bacterium]
AYADAAGGMRVGPRSAGAEPGPVCYGRGGTASTVTDANLLLGYLNPATLVGGDLPLDYAAAERAMGDLGSQLGLSLVDTAYGIHLIANATMMRALQAVTSERGRDPSQFSLLAIGGNGPVHATHLAESLGVRRVIVPPVAGLFSALGMLFADVEHQFITAFFRRLDGVGARDLDAVAAPYVAEARRLLALEGYGDPGRHEIALYADVKYVGQTAPLALRLPAFPATDAMLAEIPARYGELHEQTYGYRSDREPLQLVALKVVGRGIPDRPRVPQRIVQAREATAQRAERRAYFGPDLGWQPAQLLPRSTLGWEPVRGPLIVEEYDATTVVRPQWSARVDGWNNIVLERMA